MTKKIKQPTAEQQELLNDVISNTADKVRIAGTKKTYRIRWMKWGTRRKITRIMQSKKETDELLFIYKVTACVILNGYWKIKLFYPFLWRWFAYVKEYREDQLSPIIETGKKKVPVDNFYLTTISVIAMQDLMMTMMKTEASHILHEQVMGQGTPAEKKDNG
jgi:hypothetical protein